MIRLLTATIVALVLVSGGLAIYQDAGGGGLDGVLGGLVRQRAAPTATATPDLCPPALAPCGGAPGVDVPNAAAAPTPSGDTLPPATQAAAAAKAAVRQQGYAPSCLTGSQCGAVAAVWCDACPLHVIIGSRIGASEYDHRAFFFTEHYLGTDTQAPSAQIAVISRTDDTVTLEYPLFNAGDGACCPTGGTADVRFRWDGTRLVPLDRIPDNRSPVAPPPPAVSAPPASECTWAVATLREDARLDLAGAATPQYQVSGPEFRDGSPATFLRRTAGWWTQIADWITASCAPPWPAGQCAASTAHLSEARAIHVADEAQPQPAAPRAWDDTWIAHYTRLLALVGQLCT